MNEVSSRVWIFFEAMAGRGNVTPEALTDGSGVSLERLRDPAQRFDWDVLAGAAKRLEDVVGADALVELGAESVDLPAAEPLRRGVGKLLGVGAFYRALKWLLPPFMKSLAIEVNEHDGEIEVALSVPSAAAPSGSVFLIAAGMLRRLPTLFGKGEPPMTHVVAQRSATIRMNLRAGGRPSSPGFSERARDLDQSARDREGERQGERVFQALLDRCPEIAVVMTPGGTLRFVNSAVERELGVPVTELASRSLFDRVHPEDLPRLVHAASAEGNSFEIELRLKANDGSFHDFAVRGENQSDDPVIAGVVLWARNVSSERRASRTTSDLEAGQLRLLQNLSGMAYRCSLDAGGTVELVTSGSLALLGRPPGELSGTKYSDLVHPADRKERWDRVQAALIERQPCSIEYRIATKSGEVRWVLDVSHGVYGSGGGLEAVEGFITDVTPRKRLEEQLLHAQKLEGIGRLAGGIAHDFNNLLGAILGYSDLAKSGLANDDERRTDIEQIESAARRAGELTRQLLSFARKQVVEPRVLDLSSLLLRVDNLLRRVLGEDVELATVLPQRLWSIHADPGQLEQVLVNLAINARDAMPDGGKLAIEARNIDLDHVAAERFGVMPGAYVELEVVDSGVGMTDEVKAHLFEPFFTTKETGKGTGLGLATVYGVVVQAGGGIRVESHSGEGTAFTLVFPRAVGEPSSLSTTTPSGPIPRGWETVLVVEDHALVRRATVRALEGQGYQVLVASSGSEALSVIGSTKVPVDLLVTDMVMPDMSGKQLAERLTEICPQLKVLFVSGYADITFLADRELHAQVAFLPKPFTPSVLGRKVREVLDAVAS